jgi:hypothetical protein
MGCPAIRSGTIVGQDSRSLEWGDCFPDPSLRLIRRGDPQAELEAISLLDASSPIWRSGLLIEHLRSSAVEVPTYCALRSRGYLYVAYETGEEELYDLRTDPGELQNSRPNRCTRRSSPLDEHAFEPSATLLRPVTYSLHEEATQAVSRCASVRLERGVKRANSASPA